MEKGNIMPIWQPVGYSTNLISQRVGELYGIKTSHTGTIDPMAEGVIIVLKGEDRLKKYDYARWIKEYEFDIALGVSTDTFDGLGMITDMDGSITGSDLEKVRPCVGPTLETLVGPYSQKVPIFSAAKVKGKPLHYYGRSAKKTRIPSKKGEISSITLTDISAKNWSVLVGELSEKISRVTGDFRQQEVITQWRNFKPKHTQVLILSLKVSMTKGLYVRSLSQDICAKLNTVGFVFGLTRTKNGVYTRKECYELSELFDERSDLFKVRPLYTK